MLKQNKNQRGFTLVELLVVVAIILIVAAVVVPNAVNALRNLRLNGAVSDYSNLLQQARLSAVKDNRTYQVHMGNLPAPNNTTAIAYVDVYPQNLNGTSGQGSYCQGCGPNGVSDPMVTLSSEVAVLPNNGAVANALKVAITGANFDTADDPTFGPRGTPCAPTVSGGAAYCATPGAAQQFFVIFQSNTSQRIQAVSIDGAGRVQRWYYSGATWKNQS